MGLGALCKPGEMCMAGGTTSCSRALNPLRLRRMGTWERGDRGAPQAGAGDPQDPHAEELLPHLGVALQPSLCGGCADPVGNRRFAVLYIC